jgi:adenosylhomocysteine nucleosidase
MGYGTIGIIGAMDIEVELLVERMETAGQVERAEIARMRFAKGALAGKPVVVALGGQGKVNAGLCTQVLVDRYGIGAIINTGVAGSLDPELNIGDFVVATDAVQHDMELIALGYERGQVPDLPVYSFPASDALSQVALAAIAEVVPECAAKRGRVVSGDQFIASREAARGLAETFGALCCEMEGAAIAQACWLNDVPYTVIRALSDKADDTAEMDYPTFKVQTSHRSAAVVERLVWLL